MRHARTIALVRTLFAQGRLRDVERMLEPLLEREEAPARDEGSAMIRALLAGAYLLGRGSVRQSLDILEPLRPLDALPAGARAEAALWLGWCHGWHNAEAHDESRALHYFDLASRYYEKIPHANGWCWTHLGRAQTYLTIDEYPLVAQALDEAAPYAEGLGNDMALLWMDELRLHWLRSQGKWKAAFHRLDAVAERARAIGMSFPEGRAAAYRAALYEEVGASPSHIVEAASEAVTLLSQPGIDPGLPLLLAYRSMISAHVRSGSLDSARRVLDQARSRTGALPAALEYARMSEAAIAAASGKNDAALHLLRSVAETMHPVRHRLLLGHLSVAFVDLLDRTGSPDEARAWALRSIRNARSMGHRVQRVRAGLLLSRLQDEAPESAVPPRTDPIYECLPLLSEHLSCRSERTDPGTLAGEVLGVQRRGLAKILSGASVQPELTLTEPAEVLHAALQQAAFSPRLALRLFLDHQAAASGTSLRSVYLRIGPDTMRWSPGYPLPITIGQLPGPLHTVTYGELTLGIPRSTGASEQWIERHLPILGAALEREMTSLRSAPVRGGGRTPNRFVAITPEMRSLVARVVRTRAGHSPVLISGPTGSGRTALARLVHEVSTPEDAPFVRVECRARPPAEIDRILFGQGEGSDAAAVRADDGTLVIEEIHLLPRESQERLLSLLREGVYLPAGGRRAVSTDCRVVGTTGPGLIDQQEGTLAGLLRRLQVIHLEIPSLANRIACIPVLVTHFLEALRPSDASGVGVAEEALRALLEYPWPANVRELRHELARAIERVRSEPVPTITLSDLSEHVREHRRSRSGGDPLFLDSDLTLDEALSSTERQYVRRVLSACDGRVSTAAEHLGISRQGLYKKMRRLDIDASAFQRKANA